ncbi:hypothetical protein AUP68_11728 [Ilyonectria robusta]
MSQLLSFRALIGLSLAVAMFAFLGASPLKAFTSTLQRAGLDWFSTQQRTSAASASASTSPKMSMTSKTPVYFFSHGGPDVQYQTKHPVYPILQQIGREITQQVKPKAVVVFSAHWMGEEGAIHVNKEEHTDLIYEYDLESLLPRRPGLDAN